MSAIKKAKRFDRPEAYNRTSRFYETPAGDFPSVTNVLGVVGKAALINWAANTERAMVRQAAANLHDDLQVAGRKMGHLAYLTSLDARIGKQKAHQKELAKAAEIGTQAHALVEWNMRKELGQEPGPEPAVSGKATWAFSCYETWRKNVMLKPVLIEQVVWSAKYGYAGTLDWAGLLWENDSEYFTVGDIKTGKAVYVEAKMQVAAYAHALEEMGHADAGSAGCILRLPKIETDPDPEPVFISPEEMKEYFDGFLHVLELWKFLEVEKVAEKIRAKGK